MNFLAHLVLGGEHPGILAGNFIADHVKGAPERQLPPELAFGVRMHRQLDEFTDQHPAVGQMTALFRPEFGRFSGIVADVMMDYFLAVNWPVFFPTTSLFAFARQTYARLATQQEWFPPRVKQFFPYMTAQDWLSGYATYYGMYRSLQGLEVRARHVVRLSAGVEWLQGPARPELEACFMAFFPQARQRAGELLGKRGGW